jgi:predicted methyltransferase
MIDRRTTLLSGLALTALGALAAGAASADDARLAAAIAGPQRSAENRVRDRYRHPLECLAFWGLKPGMVVADIQPAGGYWTEIIAPYLARTGGRYVAAMADPSASDAARRGHDAFAAKYADAAVFGKIDFVTFGAAAGFVAPAASIDLILYSRYVHNLMGTPGALQRALGGMRAALRPGGVLAVEEHRADPRPMVKDGRDGYVETAFVIAQAKEAGFIFDAASEINANPKDTKDHPFGVWTLPPTRRSSPFGQPEDPAFAHAKYDAIGESDRMTLRFSKAT